MTGQQAVRYSTHRDYLTVGQEASKVLEALACEDQAKEFPTGGWEGETWTWKTGFEDTRKLAL